MTPIADFIGPLAEGVILLGIVPAVVLVTAMVAISRLVESRSLPSKGSDTNGQLPGSEI